MKAKVQPCPDFDEAALKFLHEKMKRNLDAEDYYREPVVDYQNSDRDELFTIYRINNMITNRTMRPRQKKKQDPCQQIIKTLNFDGKPANAEPQAPKAKSGIAKLMEEYQRKRASLVVKVDQLPEKARAKASLTRTASKAMSQTLDNGPQTQEATDDHANDLLEVQERKPVRPKARPSFISCMEALNQQRDIRNSIQFENKVLMKQNSKILEIDTTVPGQRFSEVFLQNIHRGMKLQCKDQDKNNFSVFKETDYHLLHGLDFEKVKLHDAKPNAVQKAILEADDLLVQRHHYLRNQKERIANWHPNFKELENATLTKYRKFKNCLSKIQLVAMIFKLKKSKKSFYEEFEKHQHLRAVLENDKEFQQQIEMAMPETKYYLNEMLRDPDPNFFERLGEFGEDLGPEMAGSKLDRFCEQLKVITQQQARYNELEQARGLQVIDLRAGFQEAPERQRSGRGDGKEPGSCVQSHINSSPSASPRASAGLAPAKPRKSRRVSTLKYLLRAPSSQSAVLAVSRGSSQNPTFIRIKKDSKALLKIRYLIQKHFLTGFPHSIKKIQRDPFDFVFIAKLAGLNRALAESFEGGSNLLTAYRKLNFNLFNNEYLVKMQSAMASKTIMAKLSVMPTAQQAEFNRPKDFNTLFPGEIGNQRFYDQAKKGHISASTQKQLDAAKEQKRLAGEQAVHPPLSAESHTQMALQHFFERCEEEHILPQPSFIKFNDGCLFLCEQHISDEQAVILKEYLIQIKNIPSKQVKSLVIDSCSLADESFAMILEGIRLQTPPRARRLLLKQLVYSNNKIGPKAQAALEKIIPSLVEFQINNVKIAQSQTRELVEQIRNGKRLQKIRLSNVDLNDDRLIVPLLDVISSQSKVLLNLDLSWSNLSTRSLSLIADELKNNPFGLKNLDLSYNQLCWSEGSKGQAKNAANSKLFVRNLIAYLKETDLLNHINLSGMNLGATHLVEICSPMACCPNLMGIHLNDNGIINPEDDELMTEILDVFGLGQIDISQACRAKLDHKFEQEYAIPGQAIELDEKERPLTTPEILALMEWREREKRKQTLPVKQAHADKEEMLARKMYKDHIMLTKYQKQLHENRLELQANRGAGIGRSSDNMVDHFVLTRKINNPELIFNQDPHKDHLKQHRYFEVEAAECWRLSQRSECFVCDGYKYTAIFFKKGILSKYNSEELEEIKDEMILARLQNQYDRDPSNEGIHAPIICGSVVDGGDFKHPYSRFNFDRKLRMLRCELFGALLVSSSTHFIKKKAHYRAIQTGIVKVCEYDGVQALETVGILGKLVGWADVVHDKCCMNELTDVHVENASDFKDLRGPSAKDFYVYANYLKPGKHKFLIYCRQSNRAFVKSILVGINTQDFYPEFPKQINGGVRKKLIQNVWRQWIEDSPEGLGRCFSTDTSWQEFNLGLVVKDDAEVSRITNTLLDNYLIIKNNFLESIKNSEKYPRVDFVTAMKTYSSPSNQCCSAAGGKELLMQSQVELCFIRATRNGKVKGLKGKINRAEYLDFIVRLAIAAYPKVSPNEAVQLYLDQFLIPVFEEQTFMQERKSIRDRAQLNKTLFENRNGLQWIYNTHRAPQSGFGVQQATTLLKGIIDKLEGGLDAAAIQERFLFAQMTILNDQLTERKYSHLYYVEFLDFLCRMALALVDIQEPIEYRVMILLEHLYDQEGIRTPAMAAVKSPDVDISLVPIALDEEEDD